MKLKYTGIYAPNSSWEENFYHTGPVLVQNGVVETDDEIVIEALKKSGFVSYDKWEKEEAEKVDEAQVAAAKANKEAMDYATDQLRRSGRLKEIKKLEKEAEDSKKEPVETGIQAVVGYEEQGVHNVEPEHIGSDGDEPAHTEGEQ